MKQLLNQLLISGYVGKRYGDVAGVVLDHTSGIFCHQQSTNKQEEGSTRTNTIDTIIRTKDAQCVVFMLHNCDMILCNK